MYAAVLDACVLVPNALCDTLLRFAERGFFRPLWSEQILEETAYAIKRIHPDIPDDRIRRRIDMMKDVFDDALVENWQEVSAGLDLPDDDDRHVLGAAIAGSAQSIVTFNLRDFPAQRLETHGVEARHPDEFLLDQLDLHPGLALQTLQAQAADLVNPPVDIFGLLNRLERCGVPAFVDEVRLMLQ